MKTTADFVADELRRQENLLPTRALPEPEDWERRAACAPVKGKNGRWEGHWDLFFQPDGLHGHRPSEDAQREAEAKALCAACPVRELCLAKADAADERLGIWAGLDMAKEWRSRLEQRRRQAQAAANEWVDSYVKEGRAS